MRSANPHLIPARGAPVPRFRVVHTPASSAAICFSILAGAKRHRIEPFAYVSALLIALSSNHVDLASLLPDVWIAAHPEHFLTYRRDEAEAAAIARRRRRERRRGKAPEHSRSPEMAGVCMARN